MKDNNNIVGSILSHPFATIMIASCLFNGVSNIISSAKGAGASPMVTIKNETSKSN